ncbi:MAG TPA: sensor histidine kinase [Thermoanaerobaculia bacterium]|nr:sensor histidine kinase [Thermoanaerobaculia bacterium]
MPNEAEPFDRPAAPAGDVVERLRQIHRENELLFARLVKGEERFRALARSVWAVQEEERRRVARELHDGLGQTLTALKIRLERLGARVSGRGVDGAAELAAELASTVELAGEALAEARRLAHLLRPQMLDDLGLYPALRWLGRALGEWTGFGVTLDLAGDRSEDPDERLDPEIETLAFRVVQEGLTNAIKHSGAAGAWVRVERREESLRLRIADRGSGFDPAGVLLGSESAAGFGLRGMRDRVELAAGRFELRSRAGEGTELEVELPLAAPAREADSGAGKET